MTLKISRTLELPLDFVTQPAAILAMRGAGKSNTAVRTAEEMHKAKLIMDVLVDVYPESLTAEQIAAAIANKTQGETTYTASGGGFQNALGRLNTLSLITRSGGVARASDDLFA